MTDVSLLAPKPLEGHCHFYVSRKKRFCRMTVKPGFTYCGEHILKVDLDDKTNDKANSLLRMVCPLDSTHTCFVSKLDKHLKVCNARQKDLPSYIERNCNIPEESNVVNIEKVPLCNVPTTKVIEIIATVEKIYEDLIKCNISNAPETQAHPAVSDELCNESRGNNTKRHLEQTSSLLNIIEAKKMLNDNTCYAELGAGKGHVSFYLASVVKNMNNSSVLLVDRASHRHKQDNKLDKQNFTVTRIRADISDLMISEIPSVKAREKVVGVSKHLCGAATDLALRCLTNKSVIEKTFGIVMALCCHHQCQWLSYTGTDFLKGNNINQQEFDIICSLVSWATCGSGLSRSRRMEQELLYPHKKMKRHSVSQDNITNQDNSPKSLSNNDLKESNIDDAKILVVNTNVTDQIEKEDNKRKPKDRIDLGLSLSQREDIGYKAKAVLDWGRVLFLREKGFDANLCYYVDKTVSPENVCLVATKSKQS